MNTILNKILYGNTQVTEYTSIIVRGSIPEKVFLKINDSIIDVSQDHWTLCLKPVTFGIWVRKERSATFFQNSLYTLLFIETISKSHKKLAEVKLDYANSIHEQNGTLLIAKLADCKLHHTSFLEQIFLFSRYYRKPGFSFRTFKSYVAAFSFPRKVRVVSFEDNASYTIFPMDFVGNPGGTNRFVFGLRHTNQALKKIMQAKKLVVAEVPYARKEDIYNLGTYHSAAPPPKEQLPFKTVNSRRFGFPVPEWAGSYTEVYITHTLDIGSHMLLWGESGFVESLNPLAGNLYHIHFLLHLFRKRHIPA